MLSSDFKDLIVWKKAVDLVTEVYKTVAKFPKEEIYGITSQIKRSSVSIPSNVAEGQARYNTKDFIHFLHYARGSAAELETQLIISLNVGLAKKEDVDPLINELRNINKLTVNLIKALENLKNPNPKNPKNLKNPKPQKPQKPTKTTTITTTKIKI